MGLLEETLQGKSLADYTNTQLRIALGTALYTNTADMWSAYLQQQGYSGSVADMMARWWQANSVPLQFRNYISSGLYIDSFSPSSLFVGGYRGVFYDNNDLSSFYLDSALTVPATVNGLVGGQLDKSGNGKHRIQSTTGNKPVLRGTPVGSSLVSNGDFASDAGWTLGAGWAVGSGTLNGTGVTTGYNKAVFSGATITAGNVYRITYTVSGHVSGGIRIALGASTGPTTDGAIRAGNGTYVEYINAGYSGVVQFVRANTDFTGSLDNVEVVDVSAGSVQAPYGLQYDGVDDFMSVAGVDFSATDKVFVCAGVQKLSDAATGCFVETGAGGAAQNFWLNAPQLGSGNYLFASRGSAAASTATATTYTAPITSVVTGEGDISGDVSRIRVDGGAWTTNTADQGTGNYSNATMYFGRRAGIVSPFNGLDFGMAIVGKVVSTTERDSTEQYIASRTGVTL